MAKKKAYRYPLYLLVRGIAGIFSLLPRPVLLLLARSTGKIFFRTVFRQRKLTLINLSHAYGHEKNERELLELGSRVFENMAQTGADILKFPSLSPEKFASIVDYQNAEQVYRDLLREGRGLISLTAHIGNWELLAGAMTAKGVEGVVIGRRIYYEPYNRWIVDLRRSVGVATFYRDRSARHLLKALRQNQVVGILPDQDIDSLAGIFVDFLGRPAYTPVAPAKLSLASGAPILPNFMIRCRGGRYRIILGEVIRPGHDLPKEEAVKEMTRKWVAACETVIRRYPDQWAWMHPRWKTRPESSRKETGKSGRAGYRHESGGLKMAAKEVS